MAGVLETFFLMFESDASKLDKGLKDSDKATKGLTTNLGAADKVAGGLGSTFVGMIKSAGLALVAGASVAAIKSMVEASAALTEETRRAAKAAYKGVEDYSAWTSAVVAAGGTAGAFGSTMENLGRRTRTPVNYLLRLSRTFKGLSDIRARRLADMLGIDAGMIPILQKGEAGIKGMLARQQELGIVTKKQADVAKAYTDQLRDTNRVYEDVRRRIATAILPYLTAFSKGMENVTRFMRDNKAFTIGFFGAIAAIIVAVYLPAIISAITTTFLFLAPFIAIGAAVAAVGAIIGLVADDISNFLKGNNSLIGELSKKWPWIGELVHGVADTFKLLFDLAGAGLKFLTDTLNVGFVKAWENLTKKSGALIDGLASKFPMLGAVIKALITPMQIVGNFFHDNWEAIGNIVDAVGTVIGTFLRLVGNGLQFLAELIIDGPTKAFQQMLARADSIMAELGAKFPWLAEVIAAIKAPIVATVDGIADAWNGLIAVISRVIEYAMGAAKKIGDGVNKIKGWFSSDDVNGDVSVKVRHVVEGAQAGLRATATPLNAMSSNSIMNANTQTQNSKSVSVQTGPITVTTASTDPDAVSRGISSGLGDHIRGAIDQFDDGVAA